MRLKSIRIILCVLLAVFCVSSAYAWDVSEEVRRLNKEAPSLYGFKDAEALMWLRDNRFKMLADGTMQNTRHIITMMGENIPAQWKEIRIPVPSNGELKIQEAAWYNPMTGLKEGELEESEETLKGGACVKVIRTPNDAVGRAVVLNIILTFAKRYGVDETIALADSLPIWEQNLSVEAPEGRKLYWQGSGVKEPSVQKTSGRQIYKWTVMNQESWNGESFVEDKRPSVTFSFRKGINQSLLSMNEIVKSVPLLPIPENLGKGDARRTGLHLMKWLAEPERVLRGYPRSWVREADKIPEEGPWTPWEQTLLLNKWLNKLGWKSEVWWQAPSELNNASPSSVSLWIEPVLNVTAPGNKNAIYVGGQSLSFGEIAPSVSGAVLYKSDGTDYSKCTVGAGSPLDHRLSLLWILNMNESGVADGTLSLGVNGGWTELLSGGRLPDISMLDKFVAERIDFALMGMSLEPVAATWTPTGYKLDFKVKCMPGIISGDNLLLRLPGGIPSRVREMIDKEEEYVFRFPFMIEQKVRMQMPKGYKMVQKPALKNIGSGTAAILKETIDHWPKKAQLIADSAWVVKKRRVNYEASQVLKEELTAAMRWPVLDLPFRK